MHITDVIARLQQILELHGDIKVSVTIDDEAQEVTEIWSQTAEENRDGEIVCYLN